MSEHLIIIVIFILSILLWFYYTKSKEQDDKYIPVMVRQSHLINENTLLKQESKKLKSQIRYLEKYKDDVSKTFRILDTELVLINEHIKKGQDPVTSLTPNVLNQLFNQTNNNNPHQFNNIFSQFLTGNSTQTQETQEIPERYREEIQETPERYQETPERYQEAPERYQETPERYQEEIQETLELSCQETEQEMAPIRLSVNYVPLDSNYRKYLLNNDK